MFGDTDSEHESLESEGGYAPSSNTPLSSPLSSDSDVESCTGSGKTPEGSSIQTSPEVEPSEEPATVDVGEESPQILLPTAPFAAAPDQDDEELYSSREMTPFGTEGTPFESQSESRLASPPQDVPENEAESRPPSDVEEDVFSTSAVVSSSASPEVEEDRRESTPDGSISSKSEWELAPDVAGIQVQTIPEPAQERAEEMADVPPPGLMAREFPPPQDYLKRLLELSRTVWGSPCPNALEDLEQEQRDMGNVERFAEASAETLRHYVSPFSTMRQRRKRRTISAAAEEEPTKRIRCSLDPRTMLSTYRGNLEADKEFAKQLGGWDTLLKLRGQIASIDRDILENFVLETCLNDPNAIPRVAEMCVRSSERTALVALTFKNPSHGGTNSAPNAI